MTYAEAMAGLQGLQMFGMKPGLANTEWLAGCLGRPQDRLKFLHVAGTNGKGSTCAFLESMHREAGRRVGLYTSPHLVSFTERIQMNRRMIPEADVARLTGRLLAEVPGCPSPPTFFEVVTVLALAWFAEQDCDLVVWETGLGGRLDATNIVTPELSIITNIELDHQDWLGATHEAIAAEKGGILKPGRPAVTGARPGRGLEVIRALAAERGCPLTVVMDAADAGYWAGSTGERPWTPDQAWRAAIAAEDAGAMPAPGLPGEHQRANAALALAAVAVMARRWPVPPAAVRRGVTGAWWPGRLQVVRRGPGCRIVLDGAHNPAGVSALVEAFGRDHAGEPATLVVGMLADKAWRGMVAMFAPLAARVVVVPVASRRGLPPEELAAAFREARPGLDVAVAGSVGEALASREGAGDALILVAGSLYLVGEAMERLGVLPVPAVGERGLNEWGGRPGH